MCLQWLMSSDFLLRVALSGWQILHVLLLIVLYCCDIYLCRSIVTQCLFHWIGRQVICPHETDPSNKVLMYPEDF